MEGEYLSLQYQERQLEISMTVMTCFALSSAQAGVYVGALTELSAAHSTGTGDGMNAQESCSILRENDGLY